MTRAENAARVAALAAEGLNGLRIAERTGLSRSYVYGLLNDPDGAQDRARKASYGGTCVDCGATTDGSNGAASAPDRCHACSKEFQKNSMDYRVARMQDATVEVPRVWSDDVLLALVRRYPSVKSLDAARDRGVAAPTRTTFIRRFGSWNAAKVAAGLAPTPPIGGGLSGRRSQSVYVNAVKRCAAEFGRAPTYSEYTEWARSTGAFCGSTIRNRFQTWLAALEAAGLVELQGERAVAA